MIKIGFRVDGNKHIGLGHIFRCLHLANYLNGKYGAEITFLILESSLIPTVLDQFEKGKIDYQVISSDENPWAENLSVILSVVKQKRLDVVVVDLLMPDPHDTDLTENSEFRPSCMQTLRDNLFLLGIPVAAFSDQFDRILIQADLIINYCPSQRQDWYSAETEIKYLLGPDYYILAPEYRDARKKCKIPQDKLDILIFCGGNDHRDFGAIALDELKKFGDCLAVTVILGAATPGGECMVSRLEKQGVRAHFNLPSLAAFFGEADLVIATAGNTLFDLAALGIPAIALSTRERQSITARFFSDNGFCFDAGLTEKEIRASLSRLLPEIIRKPERLTVMSECGKKAVDGKGIMRVAEEIVEIARRKSQ